MEYKEDRSMDGEEVKDRRCITKVWLIGKEKKMVVAKCRSRKEKDKIMENKKKLGTERRARERVLKKCQRLNKKWTKS